MRPSSLCHFQPPSLTSTTPQLLPPLSPVAYSLAFEFPFYAEVPPPGRSISRSFRLFDFSLSFLLVYWDGNYTSPPLKSNSRSQELRFSSPVFLQYGAPGPFPPLSYHYRCRRSVFLYPTVPMGRRTFLSFFWLFVPT